MAKQYGLILSGKNNQKPANVLGPKPSIFGDSDSDSDTKKDVPTVAQKPRHQDIIAQQKALAEDPTVYQYDEVYDEIENKRKESKLSRKDIDKKPKYINKLLQTAARRKREYESRIEREVQKERAAEGDEFKDKESFVTSSYRKKLEEMQELREQEKREEYLEAIGDVTKQADLGGFYRHLYEQQVKNIDESVKSDLENKNVIVKEDTETETNDLVNKNDDKQIQKEVRKVNSTLKRKYRKRETSEKHSDSETDNESKINKKLQHLPSNLDADSDFSIDSSDNEEPAKEKHVDNEETEIEIKEELNSNDASNLLEVVKKDEKPLEFEPDIKEEVTVSIDIKPKIDIWKKRTVGDMFDEALKRYYMRKSARMGSV